MEAASIGKHVSITGTHIKEALQVLDQGVHEEISEDTALLCADTQLLLAEIQLSDARLKIKRKRQELMHDA